MKDDYRSIGMALLCFLLVILLNFLLPRLLPGDPVAYLTGMSEEEITGTEVRFYREALHLDRPVIVQFGFYLGTILDGSLGFSYQKEAVVSKLIRERLGATLQITLPALVLSTGLGLLWGLACGYHKDTAVDRLSTAGNVILNTVPGFLLALVLLILCCFQNDWLPYANLSSPGMTPGTPGFLPDRLRHLCLPVLTLTATAGPSRFLLMRNAAAKIADEKFVLYARQRGLPKRTILFCYILPNIAPAFLTMVGMSVSLCVGGSLVVEKLFSINGMGGLLNEAVYTLDYPLMQGILFVTTGIMTLSVILTDLGCILLDPRRRKGAGA